MSRNAPIDIVFLAADPRMRLRVVSLSVFGLLSLVAALFFCAGWIGYSAAHTWIQREMKNEMKVKAELIVAIRLMSAEIKQARDDLSAAQESHKLALIVFGLSDHREVLSETEKSKLSLNPLDRPNMPHEYSWRIEALEFGDAYSVEPLNQNPAGDDKEIGPETRALLISLNQKAYLENWSMGKTIGAIHRKINHHTPFAYPVKGPISSRYGMRRHPIFGSFLFHYGVDIAGRLGAPIQATAAGWVTSIGYSPRSGRFIRINHGYGYTSLYTHLERVRVRKGQKITPGQIIALLGNSGLTTGPHLHYEVHWNGRPVDPEPFLVRSANDQMPSEEKPGFLYFKSQCLQASREKQDSFAIWRWFSG